ncbi:MAG: hypothetical protein U0575_12650 [Phycisphaerales bacterium]
MRIDHVAYQQATRVAGLGLVVQSAVGLTLLVMGAAFGDTTLKFASIYILVGTIVWLSLLVVFHQHKLERIEAMEADELAASRGTTIFDREVVATRVAARRLQLIYTWMMPVVSLLIAGALAGAGWWIIRWFGRQGDPEGEFAPFTVMTSMGPALAVTLALAIVCFIFSRFVAGMAKQPAWQNLRGGAGFMVGNALVCLAAAVGFGFQFAKKQAVIEGVAHGLAIFMIALAAEILLNFVLNLYRPRRAGETPRPAFDSRVLSLLAAPDSIVRSINEAVNYQFGFDITSSWGYQLLLRSFTSLLVVGLAAMILLSCITVVGPDQQGVRLRFGRLMDIHPPGLTFKLPWPIETVELHQVGRVRDLVLGVNPPTPPPRRPPEIKVNFWVSEDSTDGDRRLFVTGASRLSGPSGRAGSAAGGAAAPGVAGAPPTVATAPTGGAATPSATAPPAGESAVEAKVGERFSLVDLEMTLYYRVRPEKLREFLSFASDATGRRSTQTMRERAMRSLAMRELTDELSRLPLETVLNAGGSGMLEGLRKRIQARFDDPAFDVGVEVVALAVPLLRPPAAESTAAMFEEYSISVEANRQQRDIAQRNASVTMALLARDTATADAIVAKIDALQGMVKANDPGATALRREIEQMLLAARGQPAAKIESAEARRWRTQMQARGDANRLAGDQAMYDAAPELYRQRQIMRVLEQTMPNVRFKYIVGVPPDRVRFDVNMQEPDSGLNFLDAVERKDEKKEGGATP